MAESPIPITTGTGSASVASDLVSGNNYQQIKLVDGTLGSIIPLKINADGSINASIYGNITPNQSVSGTIGASIIGVPNINLSQVGAIGGLSASGLTSDALNTGGFNGISTAAFPFAFNGSTWDRLRGSSTTGLWIYGSVQGSFSPSGNQSVSGTVQTDVRGSVATVIIGGSIAASFTPPANQSVSGIVGSSIVGQLPAGNAIIGAVAASISGTVATVVTGSVLTQFAPVASLISGVTSVITGTSSVQVLAPAAGGQRNYITNVLVTNAAAVGTTVQLFDGGNVIYAGFAAASGGGFALAFPIPLKQSSIAGNLSALTTVQASVFVSASGYTAA